MGLEAPLVGEREHLVVHTGRIADAEDVQAAVDQLLGNPVDGHVALGAYQHLRLAAQRLVDGFDEGCRLARAGRAVDDGYIFSTQHLVDGMRLGGVQVVEAHVGESVGLGLLTRVEKVAKVAQAPLGTHGAVEGLEHQAVGGLVEEELDA